jgi:kumamolisin
VAAIEAALRISMGVYQHPTENRTFYSPDREPTPELSVPLWRIAGLDNYSKPRPALVRRVASARPNATTGSGPSASFLGSDMRSAYYGDTTLTGAGQSIGLLEYHGVDLADVKTYYSNVGQTNAVPITRISTDGTSTNCVDSLAGGYCDDTEQVLDITTALGMAPGLSSLVVYVGSSDAAIFNAMATASPLNAQLSCSWGWTPVDPSTDNPYFKEFAAQGQNLFVAAGDDGGWQAYEAANPWPADDAYITSVGGTSLSTTGAGGAWGSETAWTDGGGGVSPNQLRIPSWQTAAAAGCPGCSMTFRNGPDVSANADFSYYVCADQLACTANEWGGTSFAAPIWAGYMALVNEQAVADGGTPLGFINPALYSIGMWSGYDAAFHDITTGSLCYCATVGYDLATGWGSPNGTGLINALVGPHSAGFNLSAAPIAVTAIQGQSGTVVITTSVTGSFNSAIVLSASQQSENITISFSPSSITGAGTSTMTITVPQSAECGTYVIRVTGTSGGTSVTAAVRLTVNLAPDFGLSTPNLPSVAQGSNTAVTVSSVVQGGFNSAIALSASGQPAGVKVSFSPTSIPAPGSGSSAMKLAAASTTPPGSYPITVTGTGGSITHTSTFNLTVTKLVPKDFAISASPTSYLLIRGHSVQVTLTTSVSGGFNSPISLTASGVPTGVTTSFAPASVPAPGSGTSKLNLSVSATTKTGNYSISITGTGGSAKHNTAFSLQVR